MTEFLKTFLEVFNAGGTLMYPLVALAAYMYYSGFQLCFRMRALNKICADSAAFSSAYSRFANDEFSKRALARSDIKGVFSRLRIELMSGVDRRILMLKILSTVAPLIGLLGTVTGMMLSISSAADNSSGVAAGVSRALVTTQAGLVAAIPAWVIAMFASSQAQKLLIRIAKRETALIKETAQ